MKTSDWGKDPGEFFRERKQVDSDLGFALLYLILLEESSEQFVL
jgi:hypothetical protein